MEAIATNLDQVSLGQGQNTKVKGKTANFDFSDLLGTLMLNIQGTGQFQLTDSGTVDPQQAISDLQTGQLTNNVANDQSQIESSLQNSVLNQALAQIIEKNIPSSITTSQDLSNAVEVTTNENSGTAAEKLINLADILQNQTQKAVKQVPDAAETVNLSNIKQDVQTMLNKLDPAYKMSTEATTDTNEIPVSGTATAAFTKLKAEEQSSTQTTQAISNSQSAQDLDSIEGYFNRSKLEPLEKNSIKSQKADESNGQSHQVKDDSKEVMSAQENANSIKFNLSNEQVISNEVKKGTGVKIKNIEEIKTAINQQVIHANEGSKSSLTIKLQPEELGKMQIHFELSDGVLRGKITVTNESAQSALQQQVDNIKTQIKAQGINLESIEVNVGTDLQQQFQGQQQNSKNYVARTNFYSDNKYDTNIDESLSPIADSRGSATSQLNLLA